MTVDKEEVLAHLTPELAMAAYGIEGRWSGSWLRSRRCPEMSHPTDAFGMSRAGKWHCHSCDRGGDLLALIAAGEGLDVRADFVKVVEVAAAIAGVEVEDEWGIKTKVESKPRPRRDSGPVLMPLRQRIEIAASRTRWIWDHLKVNERSFQTGKHWYLEQRGIVWNDLPAHVRISVRDLGFWTKPGDYEALADLVGEGWEKQEDRRITRAIRNIYSGGHGVALPVRHIETGDILDIRARRSEPEPGAPKIMGMPGGQTQEANELLACYGFPHTLQASVGVVVEGWADYLSACMLWPHADVLGAVSAGQYPLVAGFLARSLAERGGRLVLVAQNDPPRKKEDGTIIQGAADIAVNLASKRAIALMGPSAVSWLECRTFGVKDLNDIVQAGRAGEVRRSA